MILGKDAKTDTRVIREAFLLRDYKINVFIYVYKYIDNLDEEYWKGINIINIPYKHRKFTMFTHISRLKPDIIIAHDLPTLHYGAILKFIIRCKLIYDSHELYLYTNQFNSKSIKSRLIRMILSFTERIFIKTADIVMTVNEYIMKELNDKYKLKNNIYVIMNVVSHNIKPLSQKVVGNKYFNIIYQGVLSEGRGLEELCQAMQYTDEKVRLYIYGSGILEVKLKKINTDCNLNEKVFLMGHQPYDTLLALCYQFDAGVICFKNISKNNFLASPNKLFEYMSVGLAIIGSNFPFISKIIRENKIGITINPDDIADIVSKINEMADNISLLKVYKNNSLISYTGRYNWNIEGKTYLQIINSLFDKEYH